MAAKFNITPCDSRPQHRVQTVAWIAPNGTFLLAQGTENHTGAAQRLKLGSSTEVALKNGAVRYGLNSWGTSQIASLESERWDEAARRIIRDTLLHVVPGSAKIVIQVNYPHTRFAEFSREDALEALESGCPLPAMVPYRNDVRKTDTSEPAVATIDLSKTLDFGELEGWFDIDLECSDGCERHTGPEVNDDEARVEPECHDCQRIFMEQVIHYGKCAQSIIEARQANRVPVPQSFFDAVQRGKEFEEFLPQFKLLSALPA